MGNGRLEMDEIGDFRLNGLTGESECRGVDYGLHEGDVFGSEHG